jgi:hypothetical protein
MIHNLFNYQEYKIVLVATLKVPVATCGEWRQGWTPLLYIDPDRRHPNPSPIGRPLLCHNIMNNKITKI